MIWIPLCAVVGLCYYIFACVDAAKTGLYKREEKKLKEISSSFRSRVSDDRLEERMHEKYDDKYSMCFDAICEFVGCKPDTREQYPLINQWNVMARAAEMSKRGKLPSMMLYGSLNDMIYKDKGTRAWHEKYLLGLETALCNAGVRTFLVCECRTQDSKGNTSCYPVKLRDYVARYGYGATSNSSPIKFAQLSSHCLVFPEFS